MSLIRPTSGVFASPKVSKPDSRIEADLVKGIGDNYRSLSQSWPDSRYLVFSLSDEASHHHGQIQSLEAWAVAGTICKQADVPPDVLKNNAKALAPE